MAPRAAAMSVRPAIAIEDVDGVAVVALEGEHDLASRDRVQDALEGAFSDRRAVVIDLERADFVDSVVAAVLLEARKQAKQLDVGLGIVLSSSPANQVRRMFELSELTTVFAVYPSRAAAVDGVRAGFVET